MWQKRPSNVAKEAYSCGKRGILMWQKRPTHAAKEAYSSAKRDLLMWQKRPTHAAKETNTNLSSPPPSRGMAPPPTRR